MTTRERIEQNFIAAMKAKEAGKLSVLRLLRSAIKNAEIEKMKPLEEGDFIDIINREAKKLRDGLDSFISGGREDLADQARQELEIINSYLPAQLSEDELKSIISEKIAQLGATVNDFGKVMGAVSAETKGRADGAKVSAIVKQLLS